MDVKFLHTPLARRQGIFGPAAPAILAHCEIIFRPEARAQRFGSTPLKRVPAGCDNNY
jgi:hypothetical protein